jgi:hypothetical protein
VVPGEHLEIRNEFVIADGGLPEAGRLFARGAGVQVDFHAHRHFDDLRGLPGHSRSPECLA